jgi:16S rRNA processing protein RimM
LSGAAGSRPPGGQPEARAQLPAGRVGRAHGLDGSFHVTRPVARLLAKGAVVTVAGAPRRILRRAGTDARPIVRLDGVKDRAGAERLRGMDLTVDGDAVPPLGEGEWWAHALEGCRVVGGGQTLGTVARMLELPSCEALELEPAAGQEPIVVPLVRDAIVSVDVAARLIEVDPGFLGVGEPSEPQA